MATSKKAAETATEIPQEAAMVADLSLAQEDVETPQAAAEAAELSRTQESAETPRAVPDAASAFDAGDGYVFQEYAVTHPVGLRLRAEPSLDAPVLAVLPHGVGVWTDTIYDRELEWIYVRTGLLAGWVMARHLAPVEG